MARTHYISMLIISAASFICGIIPLSFTFRASRFCPFFLSLILCLGAGILLSTSIVHMLTEVQEKLRNTAQLYFCLGFLILYAFDEICHSLLEGKRTDNYPVRRNSHDLGRNNYSAVRSLVICGENSPLLSGTKGISTNQAESVGTSSHHETNNKHWKNQRQESSANQHAQNCNDRIQCHVEIGEPCLSNPAAKAGLIIALTIHSILEGISIGVQTKFNEILLILGSVAFHKVVLSFCLGLELHSHGVKAIYLIIAIFLFSVGSSLGIFIGTLITSNSGIFHFDAQMQALAAGSLLYVAAFEILPRERFKWQHRSKRRIAGLGQLLFVLLGFICMTSIHMYLVHPHGHQQSTNTTDTYRHNISESPS